MGRPFGSLLWIRQIPNKGHIPLRKACSPENCWQGSDLSFLRRWITTILPYPPLPRALCFQCFKKKRTKTAIFRCYSCIEIPKPFPWRTWSTAPKRSDSPWCPPLWFGWFGGRRCTQPWRPGLSPVNPETPWMFGWEIWYKKWSPKNIPNMRFYAKDVYVYLLLQVHLEDWYLHVGLCVFIQFFFVSFGDQVRS